MSAPMLTAREVAELLGVSAETILRWYRRGEIPAVKLPGGAIRFREDVLDAWIVERATPGRGALTTTSDAAQDGRYRVSRSSPLSTDVGDSRSGVALKVLTTTDDEE